MQSHIKPIQKLAILDFKAVIHIGINVVTSSRSHSIPIVQKGFIGEADKKVLDSFFKTLNNL